MLAERHDLDEHAERGGQAERDAAAGGDVVAVTAGVAAAAEEPPDRAAERARRAATYGTTGPNDLPTMTPNRASIAVSRCARSSSAIACVVDTDSDPDTCTNGRRGRS